MTDIGACEAVDIVPTEDDAEFVVCGQPGRRVVETDNHGHQRTRIACSDHAVEYDHRASASNPKDPTP